MAIPSGPQPSPGQVGLGQLQIDAQSGCGWFGVQPSEDPSQSILVFDVKGLQAADATNLGTAKAYSDAGVATRALVVHTHAISDVVGLTAALAAASTTIPTGCIVLWSGSLAAIPAGWLLCNGQNGTPDLRDRFVMGGGGNNALSSTGGNINSTGATTNNGGFTPTGRVGDTVLTIAQMPSHNHPGSGTDAQGAHAHNVNMIYFAGNFREAGSWACITAPGGGGNVGTSWGTDVQGNHAHNVAVGAQGGNNAHGHSLTLDAIGGHTHSVTINVLPPYIVLGYIMKV